MRDFKGYWLEGKRVGDLGGFVEAFRKAGLATLSRRYHLQVADEVARIVDLYRVGVGNADADGHPLRHAAATVRSKGFENLDCHLHLVVVGDTVVIRVSKGEALYGKALSRIEGISALSWPPGADDKSGAKERDRRQALAASAAESVGMTLKLLDWPLPKLRAASIPPLVPERILRIHRTASALLWMQSAFRKNSDSDGFKTWLRGEGSRSLKATSINVDREIPIQFDKDDLSRFGERRASSRPVPKMKVRRELPDTGIQPIDHADVIRSNDGRTIVAIWAAGFSPKDRIILQLFGTTLSFTQAGRDFGQIVSVPTAAVAALRSGDEIHVVEIRRQGGKTTVVDRHAAILVDMSSDSDYLSTAQNWHARPAAAGQGANGLDWK